VGGLRGFALLCGLLRSGPNKSGVFFASGVWPGQGFGRRVQFGFGNVVEWGGHGGLIRSGTGTLKTSWKESRATGVWLGSCRRDEAENGGRRLTDDLPRGARRTGKHWVGPLDSVWAHRKPPQRGNGQAGAPRPGLFEGLGGSPS